MKAVCVLDENFNFTSLKIVKNYLWCEINVQYDSLIIRSNYANYSEILFYIVDNKNTTS